MLPMHSVRRGKNPPLASHTQSFPFFPFLFFTFLIIKVGEYTYVHTHMYPYAPPGPATPFSKIHRAEVFRYVGTYVRYIPVHTVGRP